MRDALFSEKLFGSTFRTYKTEEGNAKTERCGKSNINKRLESFKLPFLNDKIIFHKGETEKLLNYQFYTTSYKACCDISKRKDVLNSSIKCNYKQNWNLVKQFANDNREKEIRFRNYTNDMKSKTMNNVNFMKI